MHQSLQPVFPGPSLRGINRCGRGWGVEERGRGGGLWKESRDPDETVPRRKSCRDRHVKWTRETKSCLAGHVQGSKRLASSLGWFLRESWTDSGCDLSKHLLHSSSFPGRTQRPPASRSAALRCC